MNSECVFYRLTNLGRRCVLMSVEDWKRLNARYIAFCKNRGSGCPILARVNRVNSRTYQLP